MLQPLGEDFKHLKRVRYLRFVFFRHFSVFFGRCFFLTVWGCFFFETRGALTPRGLREPIFFVIGLTFSPLFRSPKKSNHFGGLTVGTLVCKLGQLYPLFIPTSWFRISLIGEANLDNYSCDKEHEPSSSPPMEKDNDFQRIFKENTQFA